MAAKIYTFSYRIFLISLLFACQRVPIVESQTSTATPVVEETATTQFTSVAYPDRELSASPAQLPKLPYAYNALEKAIDAETMKLHHDRHHAAYVKNLNAALQKYPELKIKA